MSEKNIIIIGAGIAGLSVGCYLQMNGYKTRILEMNNQPGGVCSAWEWDGFVFDGCLDYLEGTGSSYVLYNVLREIGAIEPGKVFEYDVYKEIEYAQGKTFKVYADAEKLRAEMLGVSGSPQDKVLIDDLIDAIITFGKEQLPIVKPHEISFLSDYAKLFIKNFKFFRLFKKWRNLSVNEYAQRFESEDMRKILTRILRDERMSIMMLVSMLGAMNIKSCGVPFGGSMMVARNIEQRYVELGGNVEYNKKISRVMVENGTAQGVMLQDGTIVSADMVISSADGFCTIFELLEGKYVDENIKISYEKLPLYDPIIQVFFGVDGEYPNLPHFINYSLKKPIKVDSKKEISEIGLKIFNFDPSLAPEGKTIFSVMFESEFEYWENLHKKNFDEYKAEKNRLAHEVIAAIDDKYKGFKDNVETMNVVTPMTYFKSLNSWRGCCRAWLPVAGKSSLKFQRKLPGLSNFYMTGQWVEGEGGVSNIVLSSRQLAQLICYSDERNFSAFAPDAKRVLFRFTV